MLPHPATVYKKDLYTMTSSIAQSYVYFFHDPIRNIIKIGKSVDIAHRIQAVARQNNSELNFEGYILGSYREEKQLHKKFNHLRLQGEWFSYSYEIKEYISQHASKDMPPNSIDISLRQLRVDFRDWDEAIHYLTDPSVGNIEKAWRQGDFGVIVKKHYTENSTKTVAKILGVAYSTLRQRICMSKYYSPAARIKYGKVAYSALREAMVCEDLEASLKLLDEFIQNKYTINQFRGIINDRYNRNLVFSSKLDVTVIGTIKHKGKMCAIVNLGDLSQDVIDRLTGVKGALVLPIAA